MLYLLDANVLITAHNSYYPIDTVPEFWTWLVHKGQAGDLKVASILDVRRYADFGAREIEQGPHEMEDISFVFQKIAVDDLIGSTHFLDDWSGPS